jgi:DNA-directed RNA polymerase specialized sigma24 family protein
VERARRQVSVDAARDGDPDGSPELVLVDGAPGPELLVELAEDAASLWALLGRLPAKQRAVIVLRY